MSPYELGILVHYYAHGEDWKPNRGAEGLHEATMNLFMTDELITKAEGVDVLGYPAMYKPTTKLTCLVKHMCELELPVWTMIKQSNKK